MKMRLAVVSPHFPVLPDPTYGQPIYLTLLGMQRATPVELEVFCPLPTYPAMFHRLFSPEQVRAMRTYSPPGVKAHYFGYPALPGISRPLNGVVSGMTLHSRLRRFRPDLVLAYWLYPEGYGAARAAQRLGVPVITGSRGSDLRLAPDAVKRYFVRQTVQSSAAILTVSGELRQHAVRLGADPSRIHTIPNGCDASTFHYRDRLEARAQLGVPAAATVILYVGRISAPKGLPELVEAVAMAARTEPSLRLYCIGAGNFEYGGFERQLRERITALDVASRVEFLGPKPSGEVARWLAASDLLCLPSHTEGCPNVVVEALSCGIPVVGTNVGGIPELVCEGENGLLTPVRDSCKLAAALLAARARNWDNPAIAARFQRSWETVGGGDVSRLRTSARGRSQKEGVVEHAEDVVRLIVNADDLGRTEAVNNAIFDMMAAGRVTSATIMANAPAVDAALARLHEFPQCSFGVHLNITEFPPLTGSPALRALLDGSGSMHKGIRQARITPALRAAVYEEWSAQIALLLDRGVRLSHVDSHHHTHTVAGLFPALRRLRKRFGIARARVAINLFRTNERKPRLLLWKKRAFNSALRWAAGFRTPDACADFESFLSLSPERYCGLRRIELMTHPGHPRYAEELKLLGGDWPGRLDCRLASYNEV